MAAKKKTAKKKASGAKKSGATKTTAKKATAKKAPVKKATSKKATRSAATTKKAAGKKATAKKATAKKATAKKATAKKATAKKATAKKATAKTASRGKAPVAAAAKKAVSRVLDPINKNFDRVAKVRSKGQVVQAISQSTGLARGEVKQVFETLSELITQDLSKGPGSFTLPGLLKMVVRKKPATKARKGVNPFTGEEITIKAKPARNVVRARPLKNLKEAVQ